MGNNKNIQHYTKIRKNIYNANIKNLLDTNQMDLELFNSLTDKNLLSDENRIKIAMLFAKQDNKTSKVLVEELIANGFASTHKKEIRVVKKTIQEQEAYNKLSEKRKEFYNEAMEYGKYALSIEEVEEAYDIFSAGLYVTRHPIFNYYIGKALYKKGHYNSAYEYFSRYRTLGGGEKTTKSMLYQGVISARRKKLCFTKYLYDKANSIEKVLGNSNHYVISYDIPPTYQNTKK